MLPRQVISLMRALGTGRMINITASRDTMWQKGMIPYGGSKAANEANSAHELGEDHTTVNLLTPGGPAATQMISPRFDRSSLNSRECYGCTAYYFIRVNDTIDQSVSAA